MTPKEKATDLIDSYYVLLDGFVPFEKVQQCALIAIDEIMSALTYLPYGLDYLNKIDYWQEVKKEIENL